MLLEISDLNTFYEESHILHGICLRVDEGEILCLLGRNGVGKSTTLKSIIGLVLPQSGQILFEGQNISFLPPYQRANLGMGYVPEDRRIFPRLTVRENLLMGMKSGQKKARNVWSVEQLYNYFPGLKARDKQKGAYLSGGEQQMLAIARALIGNPDILLLDEPTEGLAPKVVQTLEEVVRIIHERYVAILLVEQNMWLALRLASRFYVMSKGNIVFHGTSEEFREAHEVRRKYLEV